MLFFWWDQLTLSRRRNRERLIDTWDETKRVIKRCFIPSHCYRELYQHLQNLKQGSKSIEEYHKEVEMALIRANTEKHREATMARFLIRLNHDIRDIMELHHNVELEDLVHLAMKVKKQLWRKDNTR